MNVSEKCRNSNIKSSSLMSLWTLPWNCPSLLSGKIWDIWTILEIKESNRVTRNRQP